MFKSLLLLALLTIWKGCSWLLWLKPKDSKSFKVGFSDYFFHLDEV